MCLRVPIKTGHPFRGGHPPTFITRFSELLLPTKNTLLAIDYEMLLHDKYEISWCVLFHSVNRNFKAKKQLNYRWKLLQSPKQVWAHCIAAQFIKEYELLISEAMGFLHFVYPEQEWWILLLHAFFRLQKSSADRQNQRCEKLYERLQQKDEEIGKQKRILQLKTQKSHSAIAKL